MSGFIRAHHIWYFHDTGNYMLSAWAASAEEASIMGVQELLSGVPEDKDRILSMNEEQLMKEMTQRVQGHSCPASWSPFTVTDRAIAKLQEINATRTKQHHFQWQHLVGKEFRANFVRVTDETPVMSEKESKIVLAMITLHAQQVGRAAL